MKRDVFVDDFLRDAPSNEQAVESQKGLISAV